MSEPRHGAPLCLEWASTATDRVLGAFLDAQARTALGPEHASAARDIGGLIAAGGKRIRPQFCVLGWHAASSEGEPEALARAAASLELFHLFALIHDDVMDGSALRRGRPTLHRALAARYRAHADPDHLGVNAAILIGDLAFAWSQQMLHTAGLAPGRLAAVLPVMDAMRCGVMYGQYLDLLATGAPEPLALDEVLAVARFKTATYTVERPLHLGTVLAGSEPPLLEALSRFALPLGEAVQLRDDLGRTGKPALAPATNVAAVRSTLDGADLSAVPEVYATVWSGLFGNLDLQPGETSWCAERPSRSARPRSTWRRLRGDRPRHDPGSAAGAPAEGARRRRRAHGRRRARPAGRGAGIGVDAVFDVVGNSVLRDSPALVRPRGRGLPARLPGRIRAPTSTRSPTSPAESGSASSAAPSSWAPPRSRSPAYRWTRSTPRSRPVSCGPVPPGPGRGRDHRDHGYARGAGRRRRSSLKASRSGPRRVP
ncbi:polyprenyl synthetase family protein [Streptomyces sp. NPDC091273]|uniref:polyprenyl synthetase family protein n=1 Tax=Streptomyces sp. NPDC091273 TaxID=3365982 RepID=UPI00380E1B12